MSKKEFSLESQNEAIQPHYKDKLLKIVNEYEEYVRSLVPGVTMDQENHAQVVIDATQEREKFKEVRKDICESFGVTIDDEHMYVYEGNESAQEGPAEQRAQRAFVVLIDAQKKEHFYGEGRIDHFTLYKELVSRALGKEMDDISAQMAFHEGKTKRFLYFKGFLDPEEFKSLSEEARQPLKTPIYDKEGNQIETPSTWYLTGHNFKFPTE